MVVIKDKLEEREMVIKKSLKAAIFKVAARFHFLNWLFLLVIAFGVASWTTKFPGSLETNLWLYILIAAIGLLSFIAWILVWGWYSVWFRYLAYGVARVLSIIRRFFNNIVIQMLFIFGFSGWFWLWRKQVLQGGNFDFKDLLRLTSMLKCLVIVAVIFTFWQICKSRKCIVILDFVNHTGDEKFKPAVEGIAARCLNEMSRRLKLLKTVDEIQPEPKNKVVEPTMDVQNIGKGFEEIIGPESSVKVGNVVSIPLRPLYTFFQKLFHGPMLKGGVHLVGENLILNACLHGGRFKGSWEITIDNLKEIQKSPSSVTEQLVEMTNLLICRILTDLSREITPRWKAMHYFTEGLWLYRETLLTEKRRKLNLIKAKDAFSLAIRDDEQFVQCYYNFGIIYKKLESWEAAKAAFRKALEKKPDYHRCYYELALIHYNCYLDVSEDRCVREYNLFDAQWFCEQAITICPTDPYYWNLMAVIQYYRELNEVDKEMEVVVEMEEEGMEVKLELEKEIEEVIQTKDGSKEILCIPQYTTWSSMTGTMLAWRSLCKSILNGEKIQEHKDTARLCTRNLAAITGEMRLWRSRFYFSQALFLDPDNNDLLFEAGQYFHRMDDLPNSYRAFKRVFEDDKEISDPFSFWAFYMNVNAQLYDKGKNKRKGIRKENEESDEQKKYKDVVINGYIHFLNAVAEIIHGKGIEDDNGDIEYNEGLVSKAMALIKKDNKVHQEGVLLQLIGFLKDNQYEKNVVKWRKETNKRISQYKDQASNDFRLWMEAQLAVRSAISALKRKKKNYVEYAKSEIDSAIKKLETKYKDEIKILGLYRYLAEANLLLESYEEALNSAREAARYAPYDPEVRKVLGNVYFELKDFSKAIHELQICFYLEKLEVDILKQLDILEKIGEAYIKEGKTLCDPVKRKQSFENAIVFFKECHDIIEDKSYDKNMQEEDDRYIEILDKTHFRLALFNYELLKYDDALSYYQTALEMAIARRRNDTLERTDYILKTLLRMGWLYMETQSFAEAEKTFKEADSKYKQFCKNDAPLTKIAIDIGILFSQVERVIAIGKKTPSEDNKSKNNLKKFKDQVDKEMIDLENNAQKELDKITQKPLTNTRKKEEIQKIENKKARLSALYHECLGRLYWKQEKMDEAKEEFEESISFMPDPRVYLYLAEFYLHEASESRIGRKEILLAKTRNACKLCRKNDLRQQYEKELTDLEKKLEAHEK